MTRANHPHVRPASWQARALPVAVPKQFDPGAHTVTEVLAYLADHPDQADQVREAEAAGKGRVTILQALAAT